MTACLHGDHEFPVEDDREAYCEEHGVRLVRLAPTLLWNGPPITDEDLTPDTATPDESEE